MNPFLQAKAVYQHRRPDRVPFIIYDNKVHRGDFGRELRDRGMGLCYRCSTVWPQMPNVGVETQERDDITTITYHTPEGDVSVRTQRHSERLTTGGGTIQLDGMIKGVKDYDPVIFMIEDTTYYTDTSNYSDLRRDLGSDGVIWENGFEPPYNATQGYFGAYHGLEKWIYDQIDYPDHFAELLKALERRAERMYPLLAESPADVIGLGDFQGNYSPKDFERLVLPFYEKYVPLLQTGGRICKIHAHASNLNGFKGVLKRTGVDMMDAFTPPPVGDLSVADARAAWGEEMLIWVHVPETIFLYGADETRAYILDLLQSDPHPERLILSITEMGIACVSDDEGERVFKAGLRAVMDAIETFELNPS